MRPSARRQPWSTRSTKRVTVLCAGLVDATALAAELGPEAMHRLMQACLATAQQVLPPYGGP